MRLNWVRRILLVLGMLAFAVLGFEIVTSPRIGMRIVLGQNGHIPLVTDWSHRHMVFSQPSSYTDAWHLQNNQRYWQQYLRQNAARFHAAIQPDRRAGGRGNDRDRDGDVDGPGPDRDSAIHRDWGVSLGAGGTTGDNSFPAKFGFDVNAAPSCTADYVAFNTSLNSSLSIVAFDNLYVGQTTNGFCTSSTGPSVKWAYNTRIAGDTTGTTNTSIVISGDGTKVAYVETRTAANGGAILHLLKWKPGAATTVQGTIASPATPDTTLTAGQSWAIANCPAANSCVRSIVFNGGQPDTNSAPFYDYSNDVIYVGDDNGVLHKFTGVFNGTPAESVVAGDFPITVDSGSVLTSPVYDSATKNVYVGDDNGTLSFVKDTGSVTGTCASGTPPCLANVTQALGGLIYDPPIVDSVTGRVFVVDGSATLAGNTGARLFQTNMTLGGLVSDDIGGTAVPAGDHLHQGAFDNIYLSSAAGSILGHFYVCGKVSGSTNHIALYRVSFTSAGVLTGTTDGSLQLSTSSTGSDDCSPTTEIVNGTTDRIYVASEATTQTQSTTICPNTALSCLMDLTVATSGVAITWPPAAMSDGINVATNACGISVDNVGAGIQESNIYFTYQGNSVTGATCNGTTGVGCAIKLTQSLLQ